MTKGHGTWHQQLTYNPDGTVATYTYNSAYALPVSYHFNYENGRLSTITDDLNDRYFVLYY